MYVGVSILYSGIYLLNSGINVTLLTILLPLDRSTSSKFVMNTHKLLPVLVFSSVDCLNMIICKNYAAYAV